MEFSALMNLEYWHWWVLAFAFFALEVFVPGAIFIWVGFGAFATGLLLILLPSASWEIQMFLFAVASAVSIVGWRMYRTKNPFNSDYPFLNRRGAKFVGRIFILEEAIVNGRGAVRAEDTTWRVRGPDLPAGTKVRVASVDGALLLVETASERDAKAPSDSMPQRP